MAQNRSAEGGVELAEDERAQLVRWERRRSVFAGVGLAFADRVRVRGGPLRIRRWQRPAGSRRRPSASGVDGFASCAWTGWCDEPAAVGARRVSAPSASRTWWWRHWSRCRPTRRIGRVRRWPSARGSRPRRSARIWRAFGLQPHRGRDVQALDPTRCLWRRSMTSSGCYLNPPEAAVVLSVDEKSQVQALARLPARVSDDARDARATHPRYLRHGTTSLFAAFEHRRRHGDQLAAPPPPRGRVQEVPRQDRQAGP